MNPRSPNIAWLMLQYQWESGQELFIVTMGRKEFSSSPCPVKIISFFISDKKKCVVSPFDPQKFYSSAGRGRADSDKIAILAHLQEGISALDFHWSQMHSWQRRQDNIEWLRAFGVEEPSRHLVEILCSIMRSWLVHLWSIVSINPAQPRAQQYPFFFQNNDKILPQKGANY